jgi:hypothetical protein
VNTRTASTVRVDERADRERAAPEDRFVARDGPDERTDDAGLHQTQRRQRRVCLPLIAAGVIENSSPVPREMIIATG